MTARRDLKLQNNSKKQPKKINNWLLVTILAVSFLGTIANLQRAFFSKNQQLVPLQSELFDSSKYQPIELGNVKTIASQNFTEIDRLAAEINYTGESIEELADLLSQSANTEMEKARIIYAWVAQHITYDVPSFLDAVNNGNYPDVNAQKVLSDRTTICSGYSNLYFALAEAMNLKSVIVAGYAKGATADQEEFQDINHAWNAVNFDSNWYLLDATWGAGSVTDEQFKPNYKPYYFATSPSQFINSHFPVDNGWQLLAQTYTRLQFDNLPDIASRFYELGLQLDGYDNYKIQTQDRVDIKLKAPRDVVALADLNQGAQKLPQTSTLVNRKKDFLIVSVAPPEAGVYELNIYAKKSDDPEKLQEVITYQIEAASSAAQLPKIYGHFNQHQVSLIEPLTGSLKPNWSVYFNLIVPDAIDVQVVDTVTRKSTPLDGYGKYFAGHVETESGKAVIIAKFSESDQYWQLVEYE
jgi:transglutaminase/protease-like cytokinesis protein 3